MRDKVERLKKITYSILKENEGSYSDFELARKIQSIYDAAINEDSPDISGFELPTKALGVAISWSEGNRTISINGGLLGEITDDLTDDVKEVIIDNIPVNTFLVNGQVFLVDEEIFELRV